MAGLKNVAGAVGGFVGGAVSAVFGGGAQEEAPVPRIRSSESVPLQALPAAIERISSLLVSIERWTPQQAMFAQEQLSSFIVEANHYNRKFFTPERKLFAVKTLYERLLAFLRAVVSQHGPLAVIPMFAFVEEVCSTPWGLSKDSKGGHTKVELRAEFIRVLCTIEANAGFFSCVSSACRYPALRDRLRATAINFLSLKEDAWGGGVKRSDVLIPVMMIKLLSDSHKIDLIAGICKFQSYSYSGFSYTTHDSETLRLFKDRQLSPLLYLNIVLAAIDPIKSTISHQIWFNNVLISVIEVASVGLLNCEVPRNEFMLILLRTLSKRDCLEPMKRNGIAEVPAPFLEAFISKLFPSRVYSEA